jgi:hypothetical protein
MRGFKKSKTKWSLADFMYKNYCGKLLVQASAGGSHRRRLHQVKMATERMAQQLDLEYKVVNCRGKRSPIYVYYENGDDEATPIYCDEGKNFEMQEICATLKNMMFVLSFHPQNSALRRARPAIMTLS